MNTATHTEDPRVANLRSRVAAGRRRWRAEARLWIADRALAFVKRNPDVTVTSVLAHLDADPKAPAGYKVLSDKDATRYQFVRRVLHELADEGALTTREVANTRNRPATAFAPPGWEPAAAPRAARPTFEVVVDAADADTARKIEGDITAWLEKHKVAGVNALLITRLPDGTETPVPAPAQEQAENFGRRRRRARGSADGR